VITISLATWCLSGILFFACGMIAGMSVLGFRFVRPGRQNRSEYDTLDGVDVQNLIETCRNDSRLN
jgi:hypothetical protein